MSGVMVRRGLKSILVAAALLAASGAGAAEPSAARLAALPITATPAQGAGDTLVVFYSGDGGWATADRGMTEAFLVAAVALVDPEKQAELKFQPGDWLNLAAPGATPIGPALAQLKGLPLVCIYGSGEPDAACAGLPPALGRSVQVPGGHHYGGDYDRVGRAIMTALPR